MSRSRESSGTDSQEPVAPYLLPGERRPAPTERLDAPSDENCEALPQDGAGAEQRLGTFSCSLSPLLRCVCVEDAISAALRESQFISEAFPKKILDFPSFVLAQLLWKEKIKNKQSSFSEGLVQTTALSRAAHMAVTADRDQAAFTEWLQFNLVFFPPLTLC